MKRYDAKKSVCFFLRTACACIALAVTAAFVGCKQNVNNGTETPAVKKFTVTFSVEGGNGTVEAKVDGKVIGAGAKIEKDKTVVFTAVPADSATHKVDVWTVSGGVFESGTGTEGNVTAKVKITADTKVRVKFKPAGIVPPAPKPTYKITFGVEGEHGSLTAKVDGNTIGSGTEVEKDKTVTFTATPAANYKVKAWTVDGAVDTSNTSSSYTHTITKAVSVKVEFEALPAGQASYTVKHYQETLDGAYPTEPAETESLNGTAGATAAYNQKEYKGFTYKTALTKINGTVQSGGTINADGSTVIELYYERNTVKVTFELADGNVSGDTNDIVKNGKYGTDFDVPVPVKAHAVFKGWDPTLTAPARFPAADTEYTAQWQDTFVITFGVEGEHGSIEAKIDNKLINSGDEIEKDKIIVFTATPDSEYAVDTWLFEGGAVETGTGTPGNETAKVTITEDTTVRVSFTLTDQQKVEQAKEALKLGFNADDIISNGLSLPQRGLYRTAITWQSSNEGIIKIESWYARITHPEEDTKVTLTATIARGTISSTKTFEVTVRGTNHEAVIRAVEQAVKPVPVLVTKDTSHIQLSNKETVSISGGNSFEVDIEWKAEPKDIIKTPSGEVTADETETKTVTLTATAKKGNAEASKNITITVYPKNNAPELQTLLNPIMNTIPSETDADIPLESSIPGYEITWKSSDESILKVESGYGRITYDLIDRTVVLTAEIEDKTTHAKAIKTKTVTVKARKRFKNGNDGYSEEKFYEFEGDKLTLTDTNGRPVIVYRVQIDGTAKTIRTEPEQAAYDSVLMTPEEAKKKLIAFMEKTSITPICSLFELLEKPSITLKDILQASYGMGGGPKTEEDAFTLIERSNPGLSYEAFLKKSEEEQTALIKSVLENSKKDAYEICFISPETMPLSQALPKIKAFMRAQIQAFYSERLKTPITYTYRIEENTLSTHAVYDPNISWYLQAGRYEYTDPSSTSVKKVFLYKESMLTMGARISIDIDDWCFGLRYKDSPSFPAKANGLREHSDKEITVNKVIDRGDGTVDVDISGDIWFSGHLTFRGDSIRFIGFNFEG